VYGVVCVCGVCEVCVCMVWCVWCGVCVWYLCVCVVCVCGVCEVCVCMVWCVCVCILASSGRRITFPFVVSLTMLYFSTLSYKRHHIP